MIVVRTLRDDWWKVLAYTAILLFNLVATILAFPTFEKNWAAIVNLIPDFGEFVVRAILQTVTGDGGKKLEVFLGINHFFKGANVIGPAAAIVLALGTVVREVELGTIGLLLARPVRRRRLLLSWAVVHLLELIVPLLLVTLLLPTLAARLIDREVELLPFLWSSLHGAAFVTLVYAMSLLLAVLLTEQVKVAATAGGVCILSFMLYFIDATRAYTLYDLSSIDVYMGLLRGNEYPWRETAICLFLAAGLFVAAVKVFEAKDY